MKTIKHLSVSVAILFAPSLHSAMLVDFNFDNNLTNNGTLGGTGSFVTLTNNPTSEVPTYTANGGGVSGFLGDYAMDNYSATGMGAGGYGGAVQLSPFYSLHELHGTDINRLV